MLRSEQDAQLDARRKPKHLDGAGQAPVDRGRHGKQAHPGTFQFVQVFLNENFQTGRDTPRVRRVFQG